MTQALRHADFRSLFLGQTASSIGERLVVVALALFIAEETGSAADVGYVLAAHAVPLIGFLLLGGVWADRLRPDPARDPDAHPKWGVPSSGVDASA